MPDTGGDVLCPTCGQWTPPAPFCTECGATLQVGFREPGDGDSAFRRGHEVDQPGSPWGASGERFEPEPEDAAARAAAAAAGAAGAAGAARVDHFAEEEPPWPPTDSAGAAPPPAEAPTEVIDAVTPTPRRKSRAKGADAAAAAAGAAAVGAAAATPSPPPAPGPTSPAEPPSALAEPPPPPAAPPPVTYAGPPRDGDDDSSGVSGLVFVVFLGIGVLALLGGAILGGVFDGPVAEASPTPSIAASTPTPEPLPTPTPSPLPSGPAASPSPAVTPPPAADGFLARAEPCDEQPSASTCDNSGAENNGSVWILVSFRHGQPSDVVGVTVHDESGTVVDQGSIPLNFCGTNTDCAGYTYFFFDNLAEGDYDVRATRNGTEVATTAFTVN